MAKAKEQYVLKLTKAELIMLRDAVDALNPDTLKVVAAKDRLYDKVNLAPKIKPTEVICYVQGGCLSEVLVSDPEADVELLDFDGDYADEAEARAKEIQPRVDKELFTRF
jgi:hypothetical protein